MALSVKVVPVIPEANTRTGPNESIPGCAVT